MEKMRDFLRDHGWMCAVALCACAAVATGAWAVRTIQAEPQKQPPATEQEVHPQPIPVQPQPKQEWEDNEWNAGFDVAGKAEGIPEKRNTNGQSGSLALPSGESSAGKPGKKQDEPSAPADVGRALYGPPVSGSVVQAFSGDDLVYNETLEDWRTHNGADFACALGDTVNAPVSGSITAVKDGGTWGGIVEITDEQNRVWRLCGVASDRKDGETVTCGDAVGKVAGIACEAAVGTHVHLEVEKEDQYYDPASLIG